MRSTERKGRSCADRSDRVGGRKEHFGLTSGTMRAVVQRRYGGPDVLECTDGGRCIGPLGRIARARISSLFTRQRLRPFLSRENHIDLAEVADLADAGELTPVMDRTFPLYQAPAALEHVATRHARGHVVITV